MLPFKLLPKLPSWFWNADCEEFRLSRFWFRLPIWFCRDDCPRLRLFRLFWRPVVWLCSVDWVEFKAFKPDWIEFSWLTKYIVTFADVLMLLVWVAVACIT